tara:strand:+ start:240 stop:989 length:750 start_codon:yes stop_codon:yes gene_type:complete
MTKYYSNALVKNIYRINSEKSEITSQILYGENFSIILKKGKWLKIRTSFDNYIGFIKNDKYSKNKKITHKCYNLKSRIYRTDKSGRFLKTKFFLPFNSRVCIFNTHKDLIEFQRNKWIKKKDLKNINHKEINFLKILKRFEGIKYIWGGRSYKGIDCSALIQLYYLYNNKYFPRDTKDQIKIKKGKKNLTKFQKGNIIYWKGHVAVCINSQKLIHAYGPMKKVVIMDTTSTIKKIYKTASLKVKKISRI